MQGPKSGNRQGDPLQAVTAMWSICALRDDARHRLTRCQDQGSDLHGWEILHLAASMTAMVAGLHSFSHEEPYGALSCHLGAEEWPDSMVDAEDVLV